MKTYLEGVKSGVSLHFHNNHDGARMAYMYWKNIKEAIVAATELSRIAQSRACKNAIAAANDVERSAHQHIRRLGLAAEEMKAAVEDQARIARARQEAARRAADEEALRKARKADEEARQEAARRAVAEKGTNINVESTAAPVPVSTVESKVETRRAATRAEAENECVNRLRDCQEWSQIVKWGVDIFQTHNPDGANIAHQNWNHIKDAIRLGNELGPRANSAQCEHFRGFCNNAEGFAHSHIRRLG